MLYTAIKSILSFLMLFLVKVKINNIENIPKEGPFVLASNHLSTWDPIILGISIPRKLHFMAKEELFKVFLLGPLMKGIGTFPVKRGKADRNAIKEAIRILKSGGVLCIFPEGTRSKEGTLLDFHPGVTMIAYKGNSPIVPIGLKGTNKIFKKGLFRTEVIINIGEPIYIENRYKGKISSEQLDEITKELYSKVKNLLA